MISMNFFFFLTLTEKFQDKSQKLFLGGEFFNKSSDNYNKKPNVKCIVAEFIEEIELQIFGHM